MAGLRLGAAKVSGLVAGLGLALCTASLGCMDVESSDDRTAELRPIGQRYEAPTRPEVEPPRDPDGSGWRVSPPDQGNDAYRPGRAFDIRPHAALVSPEERTGDGTKPPDDTTRLERVTDRHQRPEANLVSPEGDPVSGTDERISPEAPPVTTPRAVLSKLSILDLAVDDTHMYWTSMVNVGTGEEQPSVTAMNLATGARVEITAVKADSYVANMASDDTHIYWVDFGTGRVVRASKATGTPELVATSQAGPYGIAVDASGVYWTNFADGTVMRADKAGTQAMVLASDQSNPASIAVAGGYASWTNVGDGTVSSVRTDGAGLRTLATGQNFSSVLVADANFVYWANDDAGAIMRAGVVMGKGHLFIPHQRGAAGLVLDGPNLYWTSHVDSSVSRSDKTAGSPQVIARSQSRPTRIAVSGTHVYWNNAGSHTVVRLPK